MITVETAIIAGALMIVVATAWSTPHVYDYHTDLKNIAYQLSRIADALSRMEVEHELGNCGNRTRDRKD